MDYQEAIEILKDFDSQVSAKADGAYQSTIGKMACDVAISAMQELQMYKDAKLCLIPEEVFSRQCEELDSYKQLGTLEEARVAVEKQKAKKPNNVGTEGYRYTDTYRCPTCGGNFSGTGIADYCYHCGQAIDWGEEE